MQNSTKGENIMKISKNPEQTTVNVKLTPTLERFNDTKTEK